MSATERHDAARAAWLLVVGEAHHAGRLRAEGRITALELVATGERMWAAWTEYTLACEALVASQVAA